MTKKQIHLREMIIVPGKRAYLRLTTIFALLLSSTFAVANPMIAELEAQLRAADEAGITSPEIDQLREILKKIKADEAASASVGHKGEGKADSEKSQTASESKSDAGEIADQGGNDQLHYVTQKGEAKTVNVDKSQRGKFAGLYANEYRDPDVADFRYQLRADGSAKLEHRVCENCTHELDGQRTSRDWEVEYEALAWAPLLKDSGEPVIRAVKDMGGAVHNARVLVVALKSGGLIVLDHYLDNERPALKGPYGVPRYIQGQQAGSQQRRQQETLRAEQQRRAARKPLAESNSIASSGYSDGGWDSGSHSSDTATDTDDQEGSPSRKKQKVYEPMPVVISQETSTWWSDRDSAIAYARLAAVNDVRDRIREKGARADSISFKQIKQGDTPGRWSFANPDCRQNSNGKWKCTAEVRTHAYREQ